MHRSIGLTLLAGSLMAFSGSSSGTSRIPATQSCWDEIGAPESTFGFDLTSVGDVNGDGFDDVAVTEPFVTTALTPPDSPSRVCVYLGGAGGLGQTADWTYSVALPDFQWVYKVSRAGDVNGDGYDDLMVSVLSFTMGHEVLVFSGSAQGLSTLPTRVLAGDFWLNGWDQYYCSFGFSIACAGDVNGDGFDDIVIGEPYYTETQHDEGRALLFLGGPAGPAAEPDWMAAGDPAFFGTLASKEGEGFGSFVASAGDVNGDGFDDLYVLGSRRACVFLGSRSGLSMAVDWMTNVGSFAVSGDFDDDGYSDLVVADPSWYGCKGRLYLFVGSATGLDDAPAWIFEGDQFHVAGWSIFPSLGMSLASGDVDGDGCCDLVVGDRYHSANPAMDPWSQEGRAIVFLGRADGFAAEPDWSVHGDPLEASGYSVSTVVRDGIADVLVGGPFFGCTYRNEWPIPPGSTMGTGRVRLFGPALPQPSLPPTPAPTPVTNNSFGPCSAAAVETPFPGAALLLLLVAAGALKPRNA